MSLNVCLLVLRLLFFEKFAGAPYGQKHEYGMGGPHCARKNVLNLRIGLFEKPLSYIELIVLRTNYLLGSPFCAPPPHPRLGSSRGVVSALERGLQFFVGLK